MSSSYLEHIFDQIDSSGTGRISKDQFMAYCKAHASVEREEGPQFVKREELFENMDFNEDGQVSRPEYIEGMRYLNARGPPGALVFGQQSLACRRLPQAAGSALAEAGYPNAAQAAGWDGRHGGVQNVLDEQRRGIVAGPTSGGGTVTGPSGPVSTGVTSLDDHTRPVIRIPLPGPHVHGGKRFYGNVPVEQATFAPSEVCATQAPECALAPSPEIGSKSWYNTYLYYPQERSGIKDGGQFMERFVQGPNGQWLDIPKARRMAKHLEESIEQRALEKEQMRQILAGASWDNTGLAADAEGAPPPGKHHRPGGVGKTMYTDPYSGQRLVAFEGKLQPMSEVLAEHHVRQPVWQQALAGIHDSSFDNLRVPWPFGRPHRNKKMTNHVYERFDRQCPYMQSDDAYKILELPSTFVDSYDYEKWAELGDRSLTEFARDESRIAMSRGANIEHGLQDRLVIT